MTLPAPEALAPGITRLRLFAEAGAAASYLPPRDWPGVADAAVRAAGDTLEIMGADGTVALRLHAKDLGPGLRLRLSLPWPQHFYGLGESGQQFDRLGATRRLWNSQSNHGTGADIAIPLLLSTAGYGLFFDNSSRALLTPGDSVGPAAGIEYATEAGGLDLYVLSGDGLRALLGRVADLLGHATMPPRWALGYMQSTRHFSDTEDLLSVTRSFRAKQLPCDAFIFLSTYGPGQGWNRGVGHLAWHERLIPNPPAVLSEMRAAGFHVFSHEYPALSEDSPLYSEASANGYLLEYGYPDERPFLDGAINYREGQRFLDFTRPEVRRWWWNAHHAPTDINVDAWWLDGGEGPPATTTLHHGSALTLHNRYDLLRQEAFATGEAESRPEQRAFLLCRSGGPGMQRLGAAAWSGDIDCSFSTLEEQVAVGLNMGLSGVPWWGTDIGGFYKIEDDNRELFLRWFQFGAFTPVFRGHGHTWREHLPWSHGEEAEAICRRYLELRYRLMPYTYTLAHQARRDGLPFMRPMVLTHPADPRAPQVGTQYCWGDDILVAPVTRAGATHWPVMLPPGRWHDWWTGAAQEGGGSLTVEAPLDRLPLFVREGAMIPTGPLKLHDGAIPDDEITLLVYPAATGEGELYEDDGRSRAYEQGGFALTRYTMVQSPDTLRITVAEPVGDRSVVPASRHYTLRIRLVAAPASVEGGAWEHDADGWLVVRLGATGEVRLAL